MHVTNTALHLDHPGLRISEDDNRDDDGAIWSLSAVLRRIDAVIADVTAVVGSSGTAPIAGDAAKLAEAAAARMVVPEEDSLPANDNKPTPQR